MKTEEIPVTETSAQAPAPVNMKWYIPPMNIKTAQLLERIQSPFIVPAIDPETGRAVPVSPRITDVARALYIFLNQNDPRILSIISNESAFDQAVMQMSEKISFRDMADISIAIQQSMNSAPVS